jgi:glycosyltransferase involved in cell wall biosynthesis
MRAAMLRLFGFILLPAFGALAPLLAIPAITARFGEQGWAAVAIGQSLGAAGAVVVELGWGLSGSQRVARQSPGNRTRVLALSMVTQLVVLVPVGLVAAVVAILVARTDQPQVAVIAVASAAGSVNTVWFFIGTGQPGMILLTDSIPRDVPVIIAAIAIAFGASLWMFPLALAFAAIVSPGIGMLVAGVRPESFSGITGKRIWRAIRVQATALAGRVLSATYISMPITLVGIASPGSVGVFAAADRLQRMLLSGLQAVPTAMQGWVGGGSERGERLHRAWRALLLNAGMGLVMGLGFFALAPFGSHLLFSGVATITPGLASVCGLLIFIVCCSRASGGLVLVALRGVPVITLSALGGCVVGVPLILLLSHAFGSVGGLAGEVSAEACVLVIQLWGVARLSRRERLRTRIPGAIRIAYLRVEDPDYPRNRRIREYLSGWHDEVEITVMRRAARGPRLLRAIADAGTILFGMHGHRVYFVSEFSLPFVPLVWIVARLNRATIVVDRFVGKYETVVEDWGRVRPGSFRANVCLLVDAAAARLADILLVDTEVRAELLRKRHRTAARILSLPVGAPPWATAAPTTEHPGLRVLYYGSFQPLHGVPVILEALADAAPGIGLTLVGGGIRDEIEALARSMGVDGRCTFLGHSPAEELAGIIHGHDVVLGIFGDSLKARSVIAHKVWQGLACGRPVITQDSPALDEIRGLVGDQLIVIPPADAGALSSALNEVDRRRRGVADWSGSAARLERYVDGRYAALGRCLDAATHPVPRRGRVLGRIPASEVR